MRRLGYQNACLTVIAVLLGLNMLERSGTVTLEPSQASAQPGETGGLTNALEQRKLMIAELRSMGSRLDRIEAKLNSGLEVRVKDMPPVKFPPEVMRRLENRDAPAQPAQVAVPVPADPAGESK